MNQTKPRLMDWVILVYLALLVSAPHALLSGPFAEAATLLLALFPYGFFLVALFLIVLKTLFPALKLEFGHSFDRWLSIIFFLIALSLFAPALYGVTAIEVSLVNAGWVLPLLFILGGLLYALMAIFLGWRIGPKRHHADAPKGPN